MNTKYVKRCRAQVDSDCDAKLAIYSINSSSKRIQFVILMRRYGKYLNLRGVLKPVAYLGLYLCT